jgi:hypothetical protein
MIAEFSLPDDIYTLRSIEKAAQDFAHLCSVTIRPGRHDFRVILNAKSDRQNLADEFLNYVLGLSAAEQLSS